MKKSLTKKLIISMLTVAFAVVSLGTSTFAWFTMNTSVEATGMQVKAQASGGLLISTYDDDKTGDAKYGEGFKATASALITGVTTLSPVSTIDLTNWWSGTAASVESAAIPTSGSNSTYSSVTNGEGTYYLVNYFAIKTAGGSDDNSSDLVISSVTVSGSSASSKLNESLRVAVKITEDGTSNTVQKFFAPYKNSIASGNALSWKAVKAASGTDAQKLGDVNGFGNLTSPNTVLIWDKIPDLSIVEIYIYYEGEDPECKTNNTVNGVDTLSVTVGFKSVAQTPTITVAKNNAAMVATPDNIPVGKVATYKWLSASAIDGEYNYIDGETALRVENAVNGKYYKCEMTIGSEKYTSTAVLYDGPSVSIANNSGELTATPAGVVASSESYQWQVYDAGSKAFVNVSGETTATYTPGANGTYRCVLTYNSIVCSSNEIVIA